MNALDLAKRLDKYAEYSGGDWEFYENIAKMLRQQQTEIEALRNQLWELKSEPWGFDRTESHMAGEYVSHPAELTDEEISELANKYLYVLNDVPYANDIKDFARAILRKAQK
jgi:hypothetical protein